MLDVSYYAQCRAFKKVAEVGLNGKIELSKGNIFYRTIGAHTSKSRELPVAQASSENSNVSIGWLADNFHFNFLGIELKKPVLTTMLYPISRVFGSYPLSGNTSSSFPPLTNFEKAYQNRDSIRRFGAVSGNDATTAMVIRYLHELSALDHNRLMKIVMDSTRYGKRDVIDRNGIEYADLASAVGIKREDEKEITYFDFDAGDIPSYFKKINVRWIDTKLGRSSVRVELAENGLPNLTLPYEGTLFFPTTEKQREAGLEKEVPANCLTYGAKEQALGGREFTLNVPNPLDAALTFFYLTKVVAPVVEAYKE